MRISDLSSDVCSSDLIEGDAVRGVARDRLLEAFGDEVQRLFPTRALVTDHRMEKAAFEANRLAEVRALGAKPAAVRGMVGVASNLDLPLARYRRADAAADAAIGAGGADRLDHQAAAFSVLARQMRTRPESILTGTVGVQPF